MRTREIDTEMTASALSCFLLNVASFIIAIANSIQPAPISYYLLKDRIESNFGGKCPEMNEVREGRYFSDAPPP